MELIAYYTGGNISANCLKRAFVTNCYICEEIVSLFRVFSFVAINVIVIVMDN